MINLLKTYIITGRNRKPELVLINKKINWHLSDFAVSADNRVKRKVGKNLDQFMDLAREMKSLWLM